jgi:tetratricopeptide (TPR) repeat protein
MKSSLWVIISRALSLLLVLIAAAYASDEPKWLRTSSAHFVVLSDAPIPKGEQIVLRLEQMRSVLGHQLMKSKLHLSLPLDIIGVKSDDEYIQIAPIRDGRPVSSTGFFLHGDDRNYIVLNLADDKSWQTVTRDFFHLFLIYNYPPTPSWFDEGLVEYLSSLQLSDEEGMMGADPGPYLAILNSQPWIPLTELFATKLDPKKPTKPIFRAEAWMVMHYIISQDKMSETGSYFGLVMGQGEPIDQAITKAYGAAPAQLEHTIKEYSRSLATVKSTPPIAEKKTNILPTVPGATRFSPGLSKGDIGSSYKEVPFSEARALVDEMMLRLPEHRDGALKELNDLIDGLKSENPIEHHALGWLFLEQGKTNDAVEEFGKAFALDLHDPWSHYYMARMKYRAAVESGDRIEGLASMLIDLRTVIDWNADFAEAYNMLGVARVDGGGVNSAVDAVKRAVELSPRNETYLLNMAVAQTAAKQWDAATTLLTKLKASENAKIAADAKAYLDELPNAKKYGILPPRPGVVAGAKPKTTAAKKATSVDDEDSEDSKKPDAEPTPDRRKVQFAKGKLLRVDCSQPPVAVLAVAGARSLHLRTEDFHSLQLIGADQFSCDWKNVPVTVNYKAGGKSDGDLVSLEILQ